MVAICPVPVSACVCPWYDMWLLWIHFYDMLLPLERHRETEENSMPHVYEKYWVIQLCWSFSNERFGSNLST